MEESKMFIEALKASDLVKLSKIQKSDLHNHATRGGKIRDILSQEQLEKVNFEARFDDLNEMQEWYEKYVKSHCIGKEGFIKRVEAAFRQARNDSINPLVLSFGLGDKIHFNNSVEDFIDTIKCIKEEIYPSVNFIPEVSFSRFMNPAIVMSELEEILKYKFFRAIDLTGDESLPIEPFIPIFKIAKENGLICKAHVGEFTAAKNVIRVVRKLGLDEVQHGISVADSEEAMDYLVKNQILLNVCPTSNYKLKRVSSISEHPIKTLYKKGVRVSLNTDDMLIFDSSVSNEYLKLYQANVLTAKELNDVREYAIRKYS